MSCGRRRRLAWHTIAAATTEEHALSMSGERAVVGAVIVTNPSGSPITWRMFVDANTETVFDGTNALYYDRSIAANTTERISLADLPVEDAERLTVYASATGLRFLLLGKLESPLP